MIHTWMVFHDYFLAVLGDKDVRDRVHRANQIDDHLCGNYPPNRVVHDRRVDRTVGNEAYSKFHDRTRDLAILHVY